MMEAKTLTIHTYKETQNISLWKIKIECMYCVVLNNKSRDGDKSSMYEWGDW